MSFGNELPLSQHDLLDREDCAEICARVLALRNRWTERSPGRFYTLGAAAYLDATDTRDAYLAAARETNPILQENFDAVLELVREFFEEFLGDRGVLQPASRSARVPRLYFAARRSGHGGHSPPRPFRHAVDGSNSGARTAGDPVLHPADRTAEQRRVPCGLALSLRRRRAPRLCRLRLCGTKSLAAGGL